MTLTSAAGLPSVLNSLVTPSCYCTPAWSAEQAFWCAGGQVRQDDKLRMFVSRQGQHASGCDRIGAGWESRYAKGLGCVRCCGRPRRAQKLATYREFDEGVYAEI